MDHIETAILNCYGIREAEQNMVFAARLTQHGHTIQNMADLMELYHQSYSQNTVENIAGLPHKSKSHQIKATLNKKIQKRNRLHFEAGFFFYLTLIKL